MRASWSSWPSSRARAARAPRRAQPRGVRGRSERAHRDQGPHDRRPAPTEVWRVVSDPAHLPALVARRDARGGGHPGGLDQGAHIGQGQDGARRLHARGGRAAAAPRHGARSSRSRPFERILSEAVTEIDARAGGGGRHARGAAHLRQRPRGWAPLRRASSSGAPRAAQARRGARRRSSGRSGRGMRWWGWGEDGAHEPSLSRRGGGAPARGAGAREPAHRPHVALEEVRLAEPALPEQAPAASGGRWWGRQNVRQDRVARVGTRRGASYPDLVRLRSGDGLGRARRRGAARQRRTQVAGGARGLRARAGGRGAVRRRHQRGGRRGAAAGGLRGGDLARPAADGPSRRRGPAVADRHLRGRGARPARRGAAGQPRAHPRPLPAVVRVLDHRRLRGHPLRRAGVDRLRPHRRAGARACAGRPGRGARGQAAAGLGRRPGAARAAGGLGGRARA